MLRALCSRLFRSRRHATCVSGYIIVAHAPSFSVTTISLQDFFHSVYRHLINASHTGKARCVPCSCGALSWCRPRSLKASSAHTNTCRSSLP